MLRDGLRAAEKPYIDLLKFNVITLLDPAPLSQLTDLHFGGVAPSFDVAAARTGERASHCVEKVVSDSFVRGQRHVLTSVETYRQEMIAEIDAMKCADCCDKIKKNRKDSIMLKQISCFYYLFNLCFILCLPLSLVAQVLLDHVD